nr:immunoglobulin heavy chain junction region [Macaca mulatta]MOX93229.1 immunoglobulin heavy chain junction region [Macaca mulatta]MOX94454.1 immunoglobulin heavy chain junction region [Macaca mulatta]MOX95240.1 immunoglobulin heavy chain junction region [Macaca mulatta]MOX95985.1 immunoglobulin heavy chain junction region [Macaca mulatta]
CARSLRMGRFDVW